MVGGGGLARLSPGEMVVWQVCVILNVLGAGLGRVAASVRRLGARQRDL